MVRLATDDFQRLRRRMHATGIAGAYGGLCRVGSDAGGGARVSLLHQGLRFRRRWRRLQFFVAGTVSGNRLRARCVFRCESLFQRQGGNADRSQPPIPKEILMRILALAIFAIGTISAATPAPAQTYGAGYPVCLHVYGPVTYYECSYTSLPQCNASASGRSAQCVVNPYFAGAEKPAGYRRHRGVY